MMMRARADARRGIFRGAAALGLAIGLGACASIPQIWAPSSWSRDADLAGPCGDAPSAPAAEAEANDACPAASVENPAPAAGAPAAQAPSASETAPVDLPSFGPVPPSAPPQPPAPRGRPPVLAHADARPLIERGRAPGRFAPTPPVPAAAPGSAPTLPPSSDPAAFMIDRGDRLLDTGDVAGARLFYKRAADAGSGAAATRVGKTFDPRFLAEIGVIGLRGDLGEAIFWYGKASAAGDPEAVRRLKALAAEEGRAQPMSGR